MSKQIAVDLSESPCGLAFGPGDFEGNPPDPDILGRTEPLALVADGWSCWVAPDNRVKAIDLYPHLGKVGMMALAGDLVRSTFSSDDLTVTRADDPGYTIGYSSSAGGSALLAPWGGLYKVQCQIGVTIEFPDGLPGAPVYVFANGMGWLNGNVAGNWWEETGVTLSSVTLTSPVMTFYSNGSAATLAGQAHSGNDPQSISFLTPTGPYRGSSDSTPFITTWLAASTWLSVEWIAAAWETIQNPYWVRPAWAE